MGIKTNEIGSAAIIAIVVAVLVIGGGAAAYFATNGFGSNKTDDTTVTKVDKAKNNPKKKIADNTSSNDKQIPAGFPADIPIYKPAEIITSNKDGNKYRLGLQARDAKEAEVISFYKTELAKAGWSVKPNAAASSVLAVSKGNWTGSVTVHESTTTNIGTTISYILEKS